MIFRIIKQTVPGCHIIIISTIQPHMPTRFISTTLITIIVTIFISQTSSIYTNKQASECFSNTGLASCQASITACTNSQACKNQLSMYQSCSFGTSETDIFNGYCFRLWKNKAIHTKPMIQCLVQTCNLQYNSRTGLKQLYHCSTNTIAENFSQCDEACEIELHKIRDGFGSMPIEELFRMEFGDENARKIVELIRVNCVDKEEQEEQEESVDTAQQNQQEQPQNNQQL